MNKKLKMPKKAMNEIVFEFAKTLKENGWRKLENFNIDVEEVLNTHIFNGKNKDGSSTTWTAYDGQDTVGINYTYDVNSKDKIINLP